MLSVISPCFAIFLTTSIVLNCLQPQWFIECSPAGDRRSFAVRVPESNKNSVSHPLTHQDVKCRFKCFRGLQGRTAECTTVHRRPFTVFRKYFDERCCDPKANDLGRGQYKNRHLCAPDMSLKSPRTCRVVFSGATRTSQSANSTVYDPTYAFAVYGPKDVVCLTRRANQKVRTWCLSCGKSGLFRRSSKAERRRWRKDRARLTVSTSSHCLLPTGRGETTSVGESQCVCFEVKGRHRRYCGQCRSGAFVPFRSRAAAWKSTCSFVKYYV